MARALRRASVQAPSSPEEPPDERYGTLNRTSLHGFQSVVIALWLVCLAAAGLGLAYDRLSASHLFPGTRIGGVTVGSRSVGDAESMLFERVIRPLQTESITLEAAEETRRSSAWALGVRLDVGDDELGVKSVGTT